jgi:hypothetical protein
MNAAYLASLCEQQQAELWRTGFERDPRVLVTALDDDTAVGFARWGESQDADAAPGIGELREIFLHRARGGVARDRSCWAKRSRAYAPRPFAKQRCGSCTAMRVLGRSTKRAAGTKTATKSAPTASTPALLCT